jgi:D-aspartate ligase
MDLPPAVVLCCSKAGLAVLRAMGAAGIRTTGVWYGRTKLACRSRYVESCHGSPDPEEDETQFLEFLLSQTDKWTGSVLFPTDDASLLVVSKYRERLADHYLAVAEDWVIVRRLLEKVHTYDMAARCGVPCPRIQTITSVAQAIDFARQVGFPCIVKPSIGHTFFRRYRVKMVFAHSADDLRDRLARFEDYEDELMVCEFIPGDDTSGANYNSFYVDGRPRREFTAGKVRLKPSRIGFPTAVVSRHIPEVIAHGRSLIGSIGYRGFSCAEFKRDERDNTYKLMEVNARHNFSGMLALRCGINFPYLSYLDAIGRDVPAGGPAPTDGICWIDEERDFMGLLSSLWRGRNAAGAYLRPYLGRSVFAVFSAGDPLPSLQQAAESLRFLLMGRARSRRSSAIALADKESGT